MDKNLKTCFVILYNNHTVYDQCFARSPEIRNAVIERIQDASCASIGLNEGLSRANADYVCLVHQDVFLPTGWLMRLMNAVHRLNEAKRRWGVLGVFGRDENGAFHGRVWSSGLNRELNHAVTEATSVVTLDELLLVVRTDVGLRFDENLPGFHLYGTDIVMEAARMGLESYVIDNPVVHNSVPVGRLDDSFVQAYRYMQRKWSDRLPLLTCTVPITRFGWPLYKHRLRRWRYRNVREHNIAQVRPDPVAIARKLGYES